MRAVVVTEWPGGARRAARTRGWGAGRKAGPWALARAEGREGEICACPWGLS